jgi:hypothetical protein
VRGGGPASAGGCARTPGTSRWRTNPGPCPVVCALVNGPPGPYKKCSHKPRAQPASSEVRNTVSPPYQQGGQPRATGGGHFTGMAASSIISPHRALCFAVVFCLLPPADSRQRELGPPVGSARGGFGEGAMECTRLPGLSRLFLRSGVSTILLSSCPGE